MSSTKLIAIDFGSTRISAMAAEVLDNGAVRVLSEESKASDDVKWGIVDKPSGASFKVSELLKLLKNSAKMQDISLVSASIGAKSMKMMPVAISRFVPSPGIITEGLLADMMKECERKVKQPDITVFDVTPAEYMVDGVVMDDPAGKEAMQITATFNVIAGSKLIRSELERCFDRTGIVLETSPLTIDAISTVVVEEHEKEIGCALINLGATTTTLAVYHDGIYNACR
jgi:cell division protein FtsA